MTTDATSRQKDICRNLPAWQDKNSLIDQNEPRETCLWKPPKNEKDVDNIKTYLLLTRKKGLDEEQSLKHLLEHNYDFITAVRTAKPNKKEYVTLNDFDSMEISKEFSRIIIGNRRFGRNRRRDFNKIHSELTDYSMGEILDFYMRNKLKIKRKIAKYKRQMKKLNSLPTEEEFKNLLNNIKPIDDEISESIFEDNDCIIVREFNQIEEDWTAKDFTLLYLGLNDYGYNYSKLAALVGTKTDVMIENFIKQQIAA